MVFAMDGYNYNSGARNQHTTSGAYEFHIHRVYIIYGQTTLVCAGAYNRKIDKRLARKLVWLHKISHDLDINGID